MIIQSSSNNLDISYKTTNNFDFTAPIKLLIKTKTQEPSFITQQDNQLKSCFKSKSNKLNLSYNARDLLNNKFHKQKKVSFRCLATHKQPIADVYIVTSYKNENMKNTFSWMKHDKSDSEDTICGCSIF